MQHANIHPAAKATDMLLANKTGTGQATTIPASIEEQVLLPQPYRKSATTGKNKKWCKTMLSEFSHPADGVRKSNENKIIITPASIARGCPISL